MKNLILTGMCALLFFSNCEFDKDWDDKKDDSKDQLKMSVEEYILKLADDKYESTYLPLLTPLDIPELLEISESKIPITNFPRNPLSSYYQKECKLGIAALWTIESIRMKYELNYDNPMERFPSQNSLIMRYDTIGYSYDTSDITLDQVANLYKKWWNKSDRMKFEELRDIDPLGGSGLKWK